MKICIKVIICCSLLLSLILMVSCGKEIKISNDLSDAYISTNNIQYNGWRFYISDSKYIFGSSFWGEKGTTKYNLHSGTLTSVCIKPNCDHNGVIITNLDPDHCNIPHNSRLFFTDNKKIYYRYSVSTINEEKLENEGSSVPQRTDIFACYDLTTGEYREIKKCVNSEFEQLYNLIHHGDYMYYVRSIPCVDDPSSAEDYKLTLCRMSIIDYKEKSMFAFDDVCDLPAGVIPDPLAIDNDRIFFTCNETGQLISMKTDGTDFEYLIDAKDGFLGLFDAFGTFYRDGKIYFTQYVKEANPSVTARDALFLYSIDVNTKELTKLSEDYASWLFVCDDALYYEMSKTQNTTWQKKEAVDDSSVHAIKRIAFADGKINKYSFTIDDVQISGVWGAGDSLFLLASYRKDTPETSILDTYTIEFDLKTGKAKEIGRSAP